MSGNGPLSPALSGLVAATAWIAPALMARSANPSPAHPRILLWYATLRKPGFKPPDIAIPLAWTALQSLLAGAAYRLLRQPGTPARNRALAWLAANVVGIGSWNRLFFRGRSLPASTVGAAALAGVGVAFVASARKVDTAAAAAGIPYVAWVVFATVLTAEIWRRNR